MVFQWFPNGFYSCTSIKLWFPKGFIMERWCNHFASEICDSMGPSDVGKPANQQLPVEGMIEIQPKCCY